MSGFNFDLLRALRDLPLPPPPPKLTATDKMILALLAMRADRSGFCWTSYRTLAANGWMSPRAAKKAIVRLVAAGLVEIRVRRIDEGDGGKLARAANGYQVLVRVASQDEAAAAPEVVNHVHQVVHHVHQGGEPNALGVVNQVHTEVTREVPQLEAPRRRPLSRWRAMTKRRLQRRQRRRQRPSTGP